jgi:hypothetical protein
VKICQYQSLWKREVDEENVSDVKCNEGAKNTLIENQQDVDPLFEPFYLLT